MREIQAVIVMGLAFTRAFFRNKVALFFTFLFPLVFLVVFGFIFGRDSQPNFEIGLVNRSDSELATHILKAAETSEIFEFDEEGDLEEFEIQLGRGEIDGIIILDEDFGLIGDTGRPEGRLQLFYDQSDEQLGLTMISVLESLLDQFEAPAGSSRALTIDAQTIQTADLSRFDYVFSGLIGFSILSLAIFSMSEGFMQDKKSKALLRIRLAPIRAWQLIAATVFNRVLVGLAAIGIMFIAGILIFDFQMRGDYFNFFVFSILSLICLLSLGTFIASWARDSNQAAPLANLISFPMMFLSGVFFPTYLMPDWLQQVTALIPLAAIVDGLRLILTEGATVFGLGFQLAVMAVWGLVFYALSARFFRWE